MRTVYKRILITLSSSVLFACGGTGQDQGHASTYQQTYSGLVIDGYLARATVFLDTNNDGTRNAWEPFAFTDNEGYYSYNPISDTNYCASDASPEQQQYCLVTSTQYSNMVIRVDSGYDVITGEPFVGQMSRRLTNIDQTNVSDTLVSPITSLLTNVIDSSDRTSILTSLGLNDNDVDINYLNTDGAGSINTGILNSALKVHKVVSVLSDRLTDTYTEIGDAIGTPNDASSEVYARLASQVLVSGSTFDNMISDSNHLATILDSAEESLRKIYERKELNLPADLGSVSDTADFSRVINVTTNIASVVNRIIDPQLTNLDTANLIGRSRALESVVLKALEETDTDNTIENAINFFNDESNDLLVESLFNALSGENADIVALAGNDFSGDDFDSVEEITQASKLPEDAVPFSQIAGRQIRVSDLDLGRGPDRLDDSEIEWYFEGGLDDISGSFAACVKHIDNANVDGSLGEGSTRGELVDGYWSLLGANENRNSSYSLLITITFLGTTYQAIMKPAGSERISNTAYRRVRFDNDGEVKAWHSLEGLVDTVSVPTSDQECEGRLPSRIGI